MKPIKSPSATSLASSGKKTPCISALRQIDNAGTVSGSYKIQSGLTSQTGTINEAENEHSSLLIQPKIENQEENLMGSHLINNNMDLYPQTDCMIF